MLHNNTCVISFSGEKNCRSNFVEFVFVSFAIRKLQLVDFLCFVQDGPVLKKAQVVPSSRKDSHSTSSSDMKKIPVKNRSERWKITGVVALSECNLEVINSPWFLVYIQLVTEILMST
jgi:hypothetical protein